MAEYDAQPGRAAQEDLSTEKCEADETGLRAGLDGVAGLVADALKIDDLVGAVAEFAAHAIPKVDGAGVALLQAEGVTPRIQARIATAEFVHDIDKAQYQELNEGPCITSMETRRASVSGSLGSDTRWPHFGGRVARMGVHSALSLPLVVGDDVIGAINTYARSRDAFGEHAVALGTRFAASAAVSMYNAQVLTRAQERTENLQKALAARAVIDQAIGILRSRSGATAEEAFERLKRLSQAENIKLAVVAERLVEEAARRARARHRP